ncbi:type IVB secretion system protein IcmH/DotU [Azorhizobium sp. AG788]|uniref:type IVB secretion system protein IcmH/DotU n=1 Tax=Azorhizobium sp. AG788 TaxID=2183897 RepID=UPI00313879AD
MTHASDMGDDEPTVIGHRPVAVGRAGAGRDGERPSAPSPAMDSAMPLRPAPAAPGQATPPPAPGLLAELPLSSDASRPEELIAAAATPLLALVAQLRQAVDYADVTALRTETVAQIKKFDERALKLGARVSDVSAARYVLCSLLDETVMTTPWGAASNWSTHSLLNQFHGETWGGEKVFAILDRVRANPPQHLALLKLIDLCLAFGFEGKYRVTEGGQYQLEELRDELGRLWRSHVKALPDDLSPQWQGVSVRRQLRSALPLWVVFAVAGALLLGIYGLFAFRLDQGVTPIENRFERIGAPKT